VIGRVAKGMRQAKKIAARFFATIYLLCRNGRRRIALPLEEEPALFSPEEAEEKLNKKIVWSLDDERKDAIAGKVVHYCVLSNKYLPLGKVLNQECCLLVVEFRTRDETGKPSEYRAYLDKSMYQLYQEVGEREEGNGKKEQTDSL
jgi:hypothetical protein